MRPIRTLLTKAAVTVMIAAAVICQGASSADAAPAAPAHPCQPHANALRQLNQQISVHNARPVNRRQPAQVAAYNAEADQLNAAAQRAVRSLRLCLQQVEAAEAQARQQAAKPQPAPPSINQGKQGKHIVGHNNFEPGRSELTADPTILAQRAGTGTTVGSIPRGQPGFKERIDFGYVIGTYVDTAGTRSSTTIGIVHYSGDGSIHIVPAKPKS
jgi:filamentous hemagglutinin